MAAVQDAPKELRKEIDGGITNPAPSNYTVRRCCEGSRPHRGRGVTAAVNAAPAGSADALRAVADDGRLATVTGDPPSPERGVTITKVYVRPGGTQLGQLATQFGAGQLHHPVAAQHHLADAAQALAQATGGHVGGAITLTLSQSQ